MKAIEMKRDDLPSIDPSTIDVSSVPLNMQEKIRNLIIEKAEKRIAEEMKFLQDQAKHQIEYYQGIVEGVDEKTAFPYHPYFHAYGPGFNRWPYHHAYAHHPAGYHHPYYAGYGHVPYGMTKEQEEEYVNAHLNETRDRSRSNSPSKAKKAQKKSSPKRAADSEANVDLNDQKKLEQAKLEAGFYSDGAYLHLNPKHYARERARAYDQSIKSDILLCGREGSMNITYDPYYHGPYHPYQFGYLPYYMSETQLTAHKNANTPFKPQEKIAK